MIVSMIFMKIYTKNGTGKTPSINEDLVRIVEEKMRQQTIHLYITFPEFTTNFMSNSL